MITFGTGVYEIVNCYITEAELVEYIPGGISAFALIVPISVKLNENRIRVYTVLYYCYRIKILKKKRSSGDKRNSIAGINDSESSEAKSKKKQSLFSLSSN